MDTNTPQFTSEQIAFLEHYSEKGVVQHALDHAGASRGTLKEWCLDDDFAVAVKGAKDASIERAEGELRRRGMGYDETLIVQGSVIYQRDPQTGDLALDDNFEPIPLKVRKHSDRLLEVYLKANDEKYKDKGRIEHTGEGGGAIKSELKVQYVLPNGKTQNDYEE